ncbi:hypothetical protein KGQ96_20975 [Halomonas coralii]|uniref:hypothetical protein n=1 Tax=Modicisalibacter sp. R2A 31.J TaxID=2831898 RepID=UPI001CC9CDB2|nr:hypothetical protein [Modicisalibacter sp. R2A 31.J]MBZ9560521.1 hypothetical protein [Modicisalibacter sp. R2A 31.J]
MEIYQAAEQFQTRFAEDIESGAVTPSIWQISTMETDSGTVFVVMREPKSVDGAPFDVPVAEWTEDYTFITRQRGGIRHFKSLDAAARAVQQIGQTQVEVMLGGL